jgi:STAM-binding protein
MAGLMGHRSAAPCMRPLVFKISHTLINSFLTLASENSKLGIETLGLLLGIQEVTDNENCFIVIELVIPQQTGSAVTCVETESDVNFNYVISTGYLELGWIHTHPTHDNFLSSVDLHSHYRRQRLMPESIAVVCSLVENNTKFYRLNETGMKCIANCNKVGFHYHGVDPKCLYEEVDHVIVKDYPVKVTDLRNEVLVPVSVFKIDNYVC